MCDTSSRNKLAAVVPVIGIAFGGGEESSKEAIISVSVGFTQLYAFATIAAPKAESTNRIAIPSIGFSSRILTCDDVDLRRSSIAIGKHDFFRSPVPFPIPTTRQRRGTPFGILATSSSFTRVCG